MHIAERRRIVDELQAAIIADIRLKMQGRTYSEGDEPRWDEMLVAHIDEMTSALAAKDRRIIELSAEAGEMGFTLTAKDAEIKHWVAFKRQNKAVLVMLYDKIAASENCVEQLESNIRFLNARVEALSVALAAAHAAGKAESEARLAAADRLAEDCVEFIPSIDRGVDGTVFCLICGQSRDDTEADYEDGAVHGLVHEPDCRLAAYLATKEQQSNDFIRCRTLGS